MTKRSRAGAFMIVMSLALLAITTMVMGSDGHSSDLVLNYSYYLLVVAVVLQLLPARPQQVQFHKLLNSRPFRIAGVLVLTFVLSAGAITILNMQQVIPGRAHLCDTLYARTTATDDNTPAWYENAGLGQKHSLCFDGYDDHIRVNNSASLNPSLITISVWANFNDIWPRPQSTAGLIVKRTEADPASAVWQLEYDKNTIQFTYYNEGFHGCVYPRVQFSPGVWYNLAVTFSSGNARLFVNGNLVESCSNLPPLKSAESNVRIASGAGGFASGIIQNVMVYNRALTWTEVVDNFNNYGNPTTEGLILWLKLNEGTGTTAYDSSGKGNNGTILG